MFEIKSKEDVELLKEISKCFVNEPSEQDLDKVFNMVQKSVDKQNEVILGLAKQIKSMNETIKKLSKENDKILSEIDNISVVERDIGKEIQGSRYLTKEDLFVPYDGGKKLYDKITLDGIRLIHTSGKNQQFALPINVFELIVILEAYKLGTPGLTVDDVNALCNKFGITKMQFSKIYYNLLEDKFNDILHEVDKMITTSLFSVQKGFIYRNDVNTNISIKEFREMYNEYIESSKPFCTIYSIIQGSSDYNAFDIFTILRKKDVLLRIIGSQED